MRISKKIIPSAIAASILLSFTACGGGGGSSSTPTATPLSSVKKDGTAVDGYINGGTACLDLSLDGICQNATEPTTTTNATGIFSLNITAAHQTHANFDKAPVIVYGGTDIDTGKAFSGIMKSPLVDATNIIVSPLSTMVQAVIDSGKTEAEAKVAVATALGLNVADVLKDPVAEYNAGNKDLAKAAITIQKSVEVLATTKVKNSSMNTNEASAKVYEDLSSAIVSVSEDVNAPKTLKEIVSKTSLDVNIVEAIETEVNNANSSLKDLAIVVDIKTQAAKTAVAAGNDAQSAFDAKDVNIRIIKVEQILATVNASSTQTTSVLALTDIQNLVDSTNTTIITKALIATAIANSFDATITDLASALGETPKAQLSGGLLQI